MVMRIYFKDTGLDLLWWDVDEEGNVIDSNLQQSTWIGYKVIATEEATSWQNAKQGSRLVVKPKANYDPAQRPLLLKDIIDKIETIKK